MSQRTFLHGWLIVLLALLPLAANAKAAPKKALPPSEPKTAQPASKTPEKGASLTIAYLSRAAANPPVRPFFDPAPADEGAQGARLGIADDNTTGQFTKQSFALRELALPADGDPVAAFKSLRAEGLQYLMLNLPADDIEKIAALPEAQDALLLDVATRDDRLRGEACRVNLLHLQPSRAMRADALAQYLVKKRWTQWFLAIGPGAGDRLFADAMRRAAKRFGAKIAAEKTWEHSFDERRTPESEVPVFTQGADYDVLIVADEDGLFGDMLAYRTWKPRPVAGTQGLAPLAWHKTHEAWGALQLQNRFRDQTGRWMTETDYAAWLAARTIGEAGTRTGSTDFAKVRDFILGDQFALAGFKGVPLSFRRWDGQLRQPVLLAADRSLVAVAPIEGFLHPKNELDTLGYDEPETQCHY